jgi:hypothetical protein
MKSSFRESAQAKALKLLCCLSVSGLFAFPPLAQASPMCTFNGERRECQVVMPWYSSAQMLPPNTDVMLVWPDQERTTVRAFGSRGSRIWWPGQTVLINGKFSGSVTNIGGTQSNPHVYIKSETGNRFSFEYND